MSKKKHRYLSTSKLHEVDHQMSLNDLKRFYVKFNEVKDSDSILDAIKESQITIWNALRQYRDILKKLRYSIYFYIDDANHIKLKGKIDEVRYNDNANKHLTVEADEFLNGAKFTKRMKGFTDEKDQTKRTQALNIVIKIDDDDELEDLEFFRFLTADPKHVIDVLNQWMKDSISNNAFQNFNK